MFPNGNSYSITLFGGLSRKTELGGRKSVFQLAEEGNQCKVPAKHQTTAQRQIAAVLRVFRAESSRSSRKIAY